jgi:2-polyprenyl-3-methyl-5-hydroxy-6-metoxy-1,4-benzoquinol methylase
MFGAKTDREWEKFGKTDPYFGVLSHERFRNRNLTEEQKREFFQSGYEHVAHVLDEVGKHVAPGFAAKRALDFGCGVGRLVIPLAAVTEHVVGIDVSVSMLQEARVNCEQRGVTNADFHKGDDELSAIRGKYDFIHSYIVFQHIPVRRGMAMYRRLLDILDDGGVGVLHFTYASVMSRKVAALIKRFPMGGAVLNAARGRGFFAPQSQMNCYNLSDLYGELQRRGVRDVYAEYTDHTGHAGVILYFRKPEKE